MQGRFLLALYVWLGGAVQASPPGLIHIGSQKQMFLDEYLVEALVGARRVFHTARKHEGNPVIRQDRPWEGQSLHYGTVFYDDARQRFRMWYTSSVLYADEDGKPNGKDRKFLYAESRDGYRWEKPSLGFVEFRGSRDNNILAPANWPSIKGGIFVDPREQDPSRRYKALAQVAAEGTVPGQLEVKRTRVWNLYYSADAFNWVPHPGNPVIRPSGPAKVNPEGEPWTRRRGYQSYLWGPTATVGWDPIRQVYAMHMENCQHKRCGLRMRLIGRAESRDLIHWSDPQTIIVPDDRDPAGLHFYSMWATTHEGLYLGMLWNYRPGRRTPEDPLYIWPQFVFSRDGIHWDRRYREPFIRLGEEPAWDSVTIYAQQPILHGDRFFIFYHGTNFRDRLFREVGGPGPMGAMGVATIPMDGFVSLEPGATEAGAGFNAKALGSIEDAARTDGAEGYAQVITRAFSFSGKRLEVNLAKGPKTGSGEVRVEILAGDYFRVRGHTFQESDPLTRTGIAAWSGRSDLSGLEGQVIKLKFYLKNARLFAFRFLEE